MNEASIFKNLTRDVRSIGGESFHADKLHTGFPDKLILLPGGVIAIRRTQDANRNYAPRPALLDRQTKQDGLRG